MSSHAIMVRGYHMRGRNGDRATMDGKYMDYKVFIRRNRGDGAEVLLRQFSGYDRVNSHILSDRHDQAMQYAWEIATFFGVKPEYAEYRQIPPAALRDLGK